jgi:ATP-dependent protease HslVU (ClpYQ) ATPase subunit
MPPAVSSHVSFVGGNFLASSFSDTNIPQGKPNYIIRHVLHDWTDDEVVHILTNVRQAMPKQNGRLLVVEMLLRPDSSRHIRQTSVRLLALNSGITRTQEAMESLVVRAGFKVSRVTHMRAVDSVIEAVL